MVKKTQNILGKCILLILNELIVKRTLKSCYIYKREKEIMEVKYSRDVSLPEVRKIVDSYMKGHSYANAIQKVNSLGSNRNNNTNKHRTLIEQLAQPGPNNWPKFQELLKGSCMTEIYQIEIVNKLEELISNPHTAAQIPLIENKTKTPPKANTNRQKSQRSSIRSPNLKIEFPGKFLQKT